jgi:hypothetical protein
MLVAEMRKTPFQSAGRPRCHLWAKFAVGAAGAVTLDTSFSDPGIALGAFSSGVAALTFPPAIKGLVRTTYMPAAIANDNHVVVTAQDVPAGTATLRCHDDGSAEDPADGSTILVEIIAEYRG